MKTITPIQALKNMIDGYKRGEFSLFVNDDVRHGGRRDVTAENIENLQKIVNDFELPAPEQTKTIRESDLLPATKTAADYKMLDGATANEALAILTNILTNDQKNTVLSDGNGGRVTIGEFIEAAAYNKQANA